MISTVHLRKYPFHRGKFNYGAPTTSILHLMSRPTAGAMGYTRIWIFILFILASRTRAHQYMLITKSENISQWSRPFPPIAMSMPRKCSSFNSSLKKWLARWEHFRLQVSHTQQPMPFYGMVHPNVLAYQHSNVFLFPKDIPCWTENAFFFKAIWPDAWKCEYFCPNIGSKQLKWILYLV